MSRKSPKTLRLALLKSICDFEVEEISAVDALDQQVESAQKQLNHLIGILKWRSLVVGLCLALFLAAVGLPLPAGATPRKARIAGIRITLWVVTGVATAAAWRAFVACRDEIGLAQYKIALLHGYRGIIQLRERPEGASSGGSPFYQRLVKRRIEWMKSYFWHAKRRNDNPYRVAFFAGRVGCGLTGLGIVARWSAAIPLFCALALVLSGGAALVIGGTFFYYHRRSLKLQMAWYQSLLKTNETMLKHKMSIYGYEEPQDSRKGKRAESGDSTPRPASFRES